MTSLDGAALRDIIQVLRRRYPNAHLVIRPTRVQGEGAAREIARALAAIGTRPRRRRRHRRPRRRLARGSVGVQRGSRGARDCAAARCRSISAVGHETDVTIADFVADLRAPTPSAAAELVVARKDEFCARIDRLAHARRRGDARAAASARVARCARSRRGPGYAGVRGRLAMRGRHVAELAHELRARDARAARRARARAISAAATLETFDLRRRLGRSARGWSRPMAGCSAAIARRAPSRRRAASAARPARLEASARSPCSAAATRSAGTPTARVVIRDAADVDAGDRVTRDARARASCDCEVTDAETGD